MKIDNYFEHKLNYVAVGFAMAILAGLIWCIIKLFGFLSTFTLTI